MPMPTNIKVLFSLVAVLGILCVALAVSGAFSSERRQEERVTLSQVPAPVRATIEQEIKSGTLKEIDKTTVDGKTAYAARIAVNGNEQETVVGEDGKVIRQGAVEKDDDD